MRIRNQLAAATLSLFSALSWAGPYLNGTEIQPDHSETCPLIESVDINLEGDESATLHISENRETGKVSLYIGVDNRDTLETLVPRVSNSASTLNESRLAGFLDVTNALFPTQTGLCIGTAERLGVISKNILSPDTLLIAGKDLNSLSTFLTEQIEHQLLVEDKFRGLIEYDTKKIEYRGENGQISEALHISNLALKRNLGKKEETIEQASDYTAQITCDRVIEHYQSLGWRGLNAYSNLHGSLGESWSVDYDLSSLTDQRLLQIFSDLESHVKAESRPQLEVLKEILQYHLLNSL